MIIRLAHMADSHFDEHHRLEDNVRVHEAFVEAAAAAQVHAILDAGDGFERKSQPAERIAETNFLREANVVAPVFKVKGNHDAAGDLYPFQFVGNDWGVTIYERPTLAPGSATVLERPGVPPIGVLALPWFDKAHLVAGLGPEVPASETRERVIAVAREMLTLLRAEASRLKSIGVIPILVGHCLVAGSETSTGQTLIGTTVELSPQDLLDVGAAYVALGHIHKHQSWFGGRVAYSGSPQRQNFGEPEEKGWILVTLDTAVPGFFVSAEFRPLPARRIVLLEADYLPDLGGLTPRDSDGGPDVAGALVRFRYHARTEDLPMIDEDRIARQLRDLGAVDVKVEAVVVHQERIRSTEITTAETTWDKVQALWAAKSIDPPADDRDRIHQKLDDIEQPAGEEVASAVA